jgi:hypothetical protein
VAAVSPFLALLRKLKKFYGSPSPPKLKGALEIVLWENCAYLADDDRRALAFALLKKSVGLKPGQILDAEPGLLVEVRTLRHRALRVCQEAAPDRRNRPPHL